MLESGSPWNRVMIISGVVVLILAVVGIKNLVEKYKREGVVSESSGSNVVPIEKEEAANGAAELQVANPGEAKLQTANPQEAPEQTAEVEKPQPVQDSVSEQKQESSEPAPASTPPVEKAAAKAPEPTPAETTPSPVPSAQKPKAESVATPPPSSSEPSPSSDVATKATKEILLEALDKVRVNIRVGEESQSLQLQAGQVHMVRTSQKVVLDLSDGGAVNLVVNGRSRGVPGSLGEPKKVRLP
ncbi:MAG TPA: hypothetical protein DCL41_09050 [Bdellovibrionales bacterium]|nr:hypothetical protein [Bdellovibrionales bacterium]